MLETMSLGASRFCAPTQDILELQRGMEWLQSELSHALQQRGAEAAVAQSTQTQEALAVQASQHR